MTDDEMHSILPAIKRLNLWARVPYEDSLGMSAAQKAIYAYKRAMLLLAIKLGMAKSRIVAVERPCKVCKGTGEFRRYDRDDDQYWEGEDCRRCNATGKVTLRFVETQIGDQADREHSVRWHTPRPRWDLGLFEAADWEKPESTEWEPEQPGVPLRRLELIRHLNTVEAVLFRGRTIPHCGHYNGPLFYTLDLGEVEGCVFCGGPCFDRWESGRPAYKSKIVRPGFHWEQAACLWCDWMGGWEKQPTVWPANLYWPARERDLFPRWHDRAPMPDIARTAVVQEWLARRGIYEGHVCVGENGCLASDGTFVKVVGIQNGITRYSIADSQHWLYRHHDGADLIFECPSSMVWHRAMRLLPGV